MIEKGETPAFYGAHFDSLSICLSKGLGCPVGSLLLGSADFISRARRIRKVFGGGMRQAGILAAAGLYALEHHVSRLKEDHLAARHIAETLKEAHLVSDMLPVETNILVFTLKEARYSPASFAAKMKEKGILVMAISSSQVRMVTHLDVTGEMVEQTCQVLRSL